MDSLTLFSSLALALLVTLQVLELCDCASIDQIISEAAESPEAFNFLHDDVGTVKVELDMLFTREQWAEIQRLNSTTIEEIRTKRKAVRPLSSRWTRKTVPYSMSNHFSGGERSVITSALNEWMRYTCIKFRRSRGNENRINFQNGGGCSSFVGMLGRGSQPVTLGRGCRHKGVVIHEVGHAIGFHHEQTRPDRDNYVTIVHRNIPPSVRFNFQKYSTGVINTYSVPYDYRSIMHYGSTAFSTNGQRTIITKNPQFQNVIGNRQGLSFRDIKLANTIYNCAESCPQRSCPGEGFVGKDCKCWCPGSPVKECGGGGGVTTQRPVTQRPVTRPPVTQRPTTRRPTGNCIDSHRHCQSWSSRGECKKNPGYMLVYCKRSCNQCGSVTAICRNSSPYCTSWASRGFCRRGLFVAFMRRECKKSCNMCGRSAPAATSWSAASACVDKSRVCGYWARTGECTKNPSYMLQKCKRSCNVCGTGRK